MKLHYIANQHIALASGQDIPVIDPSTGEQFDAIARGNAADIDRAVHAAREAFQGDWGRLSATERGRLLQRLAQSLNLLPSLLHRLFDFRRDAGLVAFFLLKLLHLRR